jgi:hypothetical protein
LAIAPGAQIEVSLNIAANPESGRNLVDFDGSLPLNRLSCSRLVKDHRFRFFDLNGGMLPRTRLNVAQNPD